MKWRRTPTYARMKAVRKVRKLTKDARISLEDKTSTPAPAESSPEGDGRGTLEQLALVPDAAAAANAVQQRLSGLRKLDLRFKFGSNAQIVSPRLSKSGNALQTGGPQVSYAIPQFLADFGMHAPGLDITGMTFAGVGPAVLIGRGNGYAWTTTTGSSDLTDTYVERLNPENPRQYLYKGQWEPMECRTEAYVAKGVAELESEEICRTRHGPIASFDEANNRRLLRPLRMDGPRARHDARLLGLQPQPRPQELRRPARPCSPRTTTCSTPTTAGTSATGIPATIRAARRASTFACPRTARAAASGAGCCRYSGCRTP